MDRLLKSKYFKHYKTENMMKNVSYSHFSYFPLKWSTPYTHGVVTSIIDLLNHEDIGLVLSLERSKGCGGMLNLQFDGAMELIFFMPYNPLLRKYAQAYYKAPNNLLEHLKIDHHIVPHGDWSIVIDTRGRYNNLEAVLSSMDLQEIKKQLNSFSFYCLCCGQLIKYGHKESSQNGLCPACLVEIDQRRYKEEDKRRNKNE